MAVSAFRKSAARAHVPVFAAAGAGARQALQDLRRRREVELVDSPRHATVLLVAGRLPRSLVRALKQVHDQVPEPRGTVWWNSEPLAELAHLTPDLVRVGAGEDVVEALVATHRQLVLGERASEPVLLPDEPPSPWKGVGPHGQGGEGMMGGRPYGRPMPMTGPDRDGLELDRLSLQVGPFFPPFPPGLALDVVVQGDVVQEARPSPNPFAANEASSVAAGGGLVGDDPFMRALTDPVAVAELEVARARHHLRWLGDFLALHGLRALAIRANNLAAEVRPGDGAAVARLRRLLERTRGLHPGSRRVAVVAAGLLRGTAAGPVSRAAGLVEDVRTSDPVYGHLGFEPVTHDGGDALARCRQRMVEAEQALALAARAVSSGAMTSPQGRVESPRGQLTEVSAPSGFLLSLLPDLLPGLEWGQAVTAVASLDLDLEEAAAEQPLVAS